MKFLIIIILIVLSFSVFGQLPFDPATDNWLYNVRGAAMLYYNTDDSMFYAIQGDTITGGLTVSGPEYISLPVFTDTTDSARLTNTTELEGRWIELNESYDGSATLFVAGDSVSGTTATVTVSYRMLIGIGIVGDTLASEKFTLGTVAVSLQKETIGDGYLIGETFVMGDNVEWTNKTHVKFYFLGTGTQVTDLISRFKRGR